MPVQQLDGAAIKNLTSFRAELLKSFHDEFEKDHVGWKAEF
jgi:hypothetical protein